MRTARFFSSEQALGEGPRQRRRIECLEEAQSIVAGFTSSVSDLLPVIPYVRFTILQSSAPSGQSIPAFGRPLLQGGTRFKLISILRGASIILCVAPPFLISNFSFNRGFQT